MPNGSESDNDDGGGVDGRSIAYSGLAPTKDTRPCLCIANSTIVVFYFLVNMKKRNL